MDTQLPVHLLAPYVSAGAREVLGEQPLSDWLESAIEDAERQLELERVAIEGGRPTDEQAAKLAAGRPSLALAGLVLDAVGARDRESAAPREEVADASSRLAALIEKLERVRAGDKEAAAEVDRVFGVIIDRVLATR
jgi:hypothetical protein